jgi:hypothetical protein
MPATVFNHFSVRDAFRRALGSIFIEDQPTQTIPGITFDKKMFRFRIAEKIFYAELSVELTTEEQAELKKCVGKLYNGEALGFLERIIEGQPQIFTTNGKVPTPEHSNLIN